jgi:hypothetical protein
MSYEYPRNPLGIGGPKPGEARNPSGRSREQQKGQLAVQQIALRYCEEAVDLAAKIMRTGTKDDTVRLQACREILDRGIGRAHTTAAIDIGVELFNRRLDQMSDDELREFAVRYDAVVNQVPKAIEHALDLEAIRKMMDILPSKQCVAREIS